uniref:Uncharacterized protein n=1 Tax=Arundo donax TaxID=35708 RepID=A0A0A9B5X1_ARUDO
MKTPGFRCRCRSINNFAAASMSLYLKCRLNRLS